MAKATATKSKSLPNGKSSNPSKARKPDLKEPLSAEFIVDSDEDLGDDTAKRNEPKLAPAAKPAKPAVKPKQAKRVRAPATSKSSANSDEDGTGGEKDAPANNLQLKKIENEPKESQGSKRKSPSVSDSDEESDSQSSPEESPAKRPKINRVEAKEKPRISDSSDDESDENDGDSDSASETSQDSATARDR
jgi:hypothetical protein